MRFLIIKNASVTAAFPISIRFDFYYCSMTFDSWEEPVLIIKEAVLTDTLRPGRLFSDRCDLGIEIMSQRIYNICDINGMGSLIVRLYSISGKPTELYIEERFLYAGRISRFSGF